MENVIIGLLLVIIGLLFGVITLIILIFVKIIKIEILRLLHDPPIPPPNGGKPDIPLLLRFLDRRFMNEFEDFFRSREAP